MCSHKENCATMEYLKDLLQSIHQIVNILSVIPALLIEHVQVDHGQERFPSSWKVSTYSILIIKNKLKLQLHC